MAAAACPALTRSATGGCGPRERREVRTTNGVDNAVERDHVAGVIASIAFRNFKALRNTEVALAPFNLVIGPNGSGKTSLIEAMLRLRTLSVLPLTEPRVSGEPGAEFPQIDFRFAPPHDAIVAHMGCRSDTVCDALQIAPADAGGWKQLQAELGTIRGYALDHEAMAQPGRKIGDIELAADGGNLAAVVAKLRERAPDAFSALTEEMLRLLPEFRSFELVDSADGSIEFGLRLVEDGFVPARELSQGILYLVGMLALAFDPDPPRLLCLEEVDRGIHPRVLREVRDALYRLSYPKAFGSDRRPVQIVTTTHSPYFIDLFREHPEEVVISHKHGRAAHFERLADRRDLPELLREGALGDMWFSGILGGVPEER